MNQRASVFICGGGTGGHFFSGLALGEKLLDLFPEQKILFIGTRLGIEARTHLTDSRMQLALIRAKGMKGKGLVAQAVGLIYFAMGVLESFLLLLKHRPRLVVGVGGYASAPTLFAAYVIRFFWGLKILVLEQNSFPGLVNRIFARAPGVRAISGFPANHFEVLPLPIRRSMEASARQKRQFSWPPRVIFILGGSQGAHGLNEKWKNFLPAFKKSYPNLKFIHQTGPKDEESLRALYRSFGLEALVFSFSNEMPRLYEEADLVISRSGAMTVFELMAFERPALFVPFPKAADDHQWKNAISVQNSDWVVRESDLRLEQIEAILKSKAPSIPKTQESNARVWKQILAELLQI